MTTTAERNNERATVEEFREQLGQAIGDARQAGVPAREVYYAILGWLEPARVAMAAEEQAISAQLGVRVVASEAVSEDELLVVAPDGTATVVKIGAKEPG